MSATASSKPRGRGCWFYGCGTLLFLVVVGLVLIYFGWRYATRYVDELVQNYTATNAMAIERVELPEEEWKSLQTRLEAFGQSLEGQSEPTELVLTERDLNGLIARDPKFKEMRDRLAVSISSNTIQGQLSMPLDDIGLAQLKGRYLNGSATFQVSLLNGQLDVRIHDMTVKGEPLPEMVMNELRKTNLAKDAQQDPETRKSISKFQSIQVQDGKIILKSKGASSPDPGPDARLRTGPEPHRLEAWSEAWLAGITP